VLSGSPIRVILHPASLSLYLNTCFFQCDTVSQMRHTNYSKSPNLTILGYWHRIVFLIQPKPFLFHSNHLLTHETCPRYIACCPDSYPCINARWLLCMLNNIKKATYYLASGLVISFVCRRGLSYDLMICCLRSLNAPIAPFNR